MTEGPAIALRQVHKSYGHVQALRGVDLEVGRAELFGFLGPNGAGKTTTIRCMLDLIRPQAGTIRVLGLDPQVEPVRVRAQVGYLPGELSMAPGMRVQATLRYLASLRKKRVDWRYVEELTTRLELDLDAPIKNLSKGNKQKVGIVQALMARPRLLLLDEPTAGLDPLMQQEVYALLHRVQEDGATIFFSSHVISEVEALAERVAIIRQGQIVEVVEPRQLLTMTTRTVRVRFLEDVDVQLITETPGVSLLSRDDGRSISLRVEGAMDRLVKTLANYPVADIQTEHPSLEALFLRYYRHSGEERS